jgi:hypothetical protein
MHAGIGAPGQSPAPTRAGFVSIFRHASLLYERASKLSLLHARKAGVRFDMATTSDEMKIVLQVGTELRITNKGEVIVSNSELEIAREEGDADAEII